MTRDFWKNKRVFITGHTGFKGSWMSLWLQALGAKVCGYSLAPNTSPSLYDAALRDSGMQSIIADIRDLEMLKKSMTAFDPEIAIHMAAQPLVRDSYVDPVGTFDVNVMGTVNFLEACRSVESIRSIVIVTTDKCYENTESKTGYVETDRLGGHDPYSASKACAELVTTSMTRSFFKERSNCFVASVRAGNVIGGGDWAKDRLVPDFMRSFSTNSAPHVRSPQAVRPWQHVMEPLSGYLNIAEKLYTTGSEFTGAWNFGPSPSDFRTVREVADRLTSDWGNAAKWVDESHGSHLHETAHLTLNSDKANHILNWQAHLDFDSALRLTTEWYKQFYSNPSAARDITLSQIRGYHEIQSRATEDKPNSMQK